MCRMINKKIRSILVLAIALIVATSFGSTGSVVAVSIPAKVPAAPKAVPWASATASGQTTIYVKWGLVPGADGYMVCRDGKRIIRTSANATVFKQEGMAPGRRYGFTVRAFKKFYQKQWYNKATGKWQASKPPAAICGSNKIVVAFVYSKPSATKYATTAPSKVLITKLSSLERKPRAAKTLTSNYGNKYSSAITNNDGYNGSAGPLTYKYLLSSKYKRITGTLYIPTGAKSSKTSALTILGDGVVLYTSPAMNKISRPVSFSVDIRGVNVLTVEWTNNSGYNNISDMECCIANCYLHGATPGQGSVDKTIFPNRLSDLTSLYSTPRISTRMTDNKGNTYHSSFYNYVDHSHGNKTPVYEYLLNSKYRRFTGTLYIPEGLSFSGAVSMTVISDGKTIYKSPDMTRTTGPVKFNVDISGCNDLRITFSDRSWYDSTTDKTLCVAYAYLYKK